MTSHILNERMRRFEPVENKCLYCDRSDQHGTAESIYYVPLYKEKDRTNIIVYSSVKYQQINVGVPRCSRCLKIHKSEPKKGYLYAFLLFVILEISVFMIFDGLAFMIGALAGALIAGFAADKFGPYLISRQGIHTPQGGAETSDFVIHMIAYEGWSLEQPKA